MNNKQREILHQHRKFLVRNIVWSDDLANKLLAQGVLTESDIREVQNAKGTHPVAGGDYGKRMVAKILDVLPVRGSGMYERFCSILLLNGHSFIADFLKDEERGPTERVDLRDLYKEVPVLEKTLKQEDRTNLENFINEKIRDVSIKGMWTKEAVAREKDKAIEAKQKQLEDAFEYEEKDKGYKTAIAALEKRLVEAKTEIIELKSQLGFMGTKIKETEDKYKNEFSVAMKYNSANENVMRRLEEKIEQGEKALAQMEKRLSELVPIPTRNTERDQMKKAEFKFAFLGEDFERFVDKYKVLQDIEKQYEAMVQERNYILTHLGHHSDKDKPSLLNAYRDFAVRTDEDMLNLKQAIEKHTNIIEGQQEKIQTLNKEVEVHTEQKKIKTAGTVWQNAIMGVMRKQLNDVKHDSRLKETRIKHYEAENAKLKARLAELEGGVVMRDEPPQTHRSQNQHHSQHSVPKESASPDRHTARLDDIDGDSVISKAESKSRRNTLLPPLGGKVLYQANEIKFQQPSPSPTRMKPKPQAAQRQSMWHQSNVALPEGLMTSQLRLEHRADEGHQSHRPGGNYTSHGYGGMKVMNGKPSKYAHVRS